MTSAINGQNPTANNAPNGFTTNLKGLALGVGAMTGAKITLTSLLPAGSSKMRSYSRNLTDDEVVIVKKAAEETIKTTKLNEKGVKISWLSNDDLKVLRQKASLIEITNFSSFKKKLKALIFSNTRGFFSPSQNKVGIHGKGATLSVFHEIGHAMNRNFGSFDKIAQISRRSSLLAAPIGLYSILIPSKTDKNKKKDIIKDNVGKLTFATFIPVIYEEARASMKGWKEAKKVLPPKLYTNTVKQGKFGFLSYFANAAMSSLGIWAGCKVKDAYVTLKTNPNHSK